jgi:hypothetical protein
VFFDSWARRSALRSGSEVGWVLFRFEDPGLIRDHVVESVRDTIIAGLDT